VIYQFKLLEAGQDVKVGDTNLFANSPFKQSPYVRSIARIGCVGGTEVGKVTFDVYYGTRKILENLCSAKLSTQTVEAELTADEMISLSGGELCPAMTEIRIVCNGTPATETIWCCMELIEHPNIRLNR
jgi:hypothetical protein